MAAQQRNFSVQSSHRFINSDKKNDNDIQDYLEDIKISEDKVLDIDDLKDFFIDNVSNDIDQILNNKDTEEEKNNDLFNFNNNSTNYSSGMAIRTTNNSNEDYY